MSIRFMILVDILIYLNHFSVAFYSILQVIKFILLIILSSILYTSRISFRNVASVEVIYFEVLVGENQS